jgi:hypothetical protein
MLFLPRFGAGIVGLFRGERQSQTEGVAEPTQLLRSARESYLRSPGNARIRALLERTARLSYFLTFLARSKSMSRSFHCLFALLALACGGTSGPRITTLPDFSRGAHPIAVVGALRRGRLDAGAWQLVAPGISAVFQKATGAGDCPSADTASFREAQPELHAALERRIREEGLDDEALGTLSPYADADLFLVIDVREPTAAVKRERADPTPMPGRPVRSGYGRARNEGSEPGAALAEGTGFRLTALVYSKLRHHLVARIDTHEAETEAEAGDELGKTLSTLLTGSRCVAWKWDQAPPAPSAPL